MPSRSRLMLVAAAATALLVAACGGDDPTLDAGTPDAAGSPTAMASVDDGHGEGGAFGEPADPADAARTVEIVATDDFRFTPDTIDVEPGEVITLSVRNAGAIPHELVLGDGAVQEEHEREMGEMGGEMMMDEANAVSLAPGETKTLTWRFPSDGEVIYGCHEPGHYDAGMRGTIAVS